jgi:hypothetical protein
MNHFDENHLGANFVPREPRSGTADLTTGRSGARAHRQLTRPGSASSQAEITAGHPQHRRMKKARQMVGLFKTST